LGDTKDELVMMLKKKYQESEDQNKLLRRELEEFKKGNAGTDA
jgi:hypothetical protein